MNQKNMNQIVINDVNDDLIAQLKQSATTHGISPEEEVKNILQEKLICDRTMSKEEALARLAKIRASYAHLQKSDSVDLLREDRNR